MGRCSTTFRIGILTAGAFFYALPTHGAEEAKSIYLLGTEAATSGITPSPGTYVSSFKYVYRGDASGAAALSRSFVIDENTPDTTIDLDLNADFAVRATAAIDLLSAIWVAPQKIFNGHLGLGVVLPVGYQSVDANIAASATVTLPDGTTLGAGRRLELSDDTFASGDPLAVGFIGWNERNWHWKIAGFVNIPIGSYDQNRVVDMGFNRWAADVTVGLTWLDQKSGFEVSIAPGFTFNGENPDTKYTTGTEFHIEGAVTQHFSEKLAVGIAGYHYRQITGDNGAGAIFGAFKGEVSAIGPNITYQFDIGSIPVFTSFRWLHEFDAKNRLEGDAGFLTVTVPISMSAGP